MSNRTENGIFITIEGSEGVGKSTATAFIEQFFKAIPGLDVVRTREPGGTTVAEKIRQLLLAKEAEPIDPVTELLLMFAGRRQHVQQVIAPALAAGKWVICDRFTDASYAYQGGGRGMPDAHIDQLQALVHPDLSPTATILLDAPVSVGLARITQRGPADRFEEERQAFFERVRAKYLERAKQAPERYYCIDAAQPLEQVHAALRTVLETLVERYVHITSKPS